MTKRLIVLAMLAALAVPALALSDDGSAPGSSATATRDGGRRVGVLVRIERRLDRRFDVFSKHCLVQNAPDRCSSAADRFVTRLERFQGALGKLKTKVTETCSAANAPARCARSQEVLARADSLLATIAADVSAIKAAYPAAGAGTK
jgi:hypothetical protein